VGIDTIGIIEVFERNVYGNQCLYIRDPELARAIAILTGRKTISGSNMEALSLLGYEFKKVLV
jgi:hypothetical protein